MAAPRPSKSVDPSRLTYEQAVEALESIITRIEEGSIGLQESVGAYQQGVALVKRCREILDAAEQEVARLDASGPSRADGGMECAVEGETPEPEE